MYLALAFNSVPLMDASILNMLWVVHEIHKTHLWMDFKTGCYRSLQLVLIVLKYFLMGRILILMGQVCIKVAGLLQVSEFVHAKHQWITRLYPKPEQPVLYIENISVSESKVCITHLKRCLHMFFFIFL